MLPGRGWTKRWRWRSGAAAAGAEAGVGAANGGDASLAGRVLAARGLSEAREFLDPKLTQLADPSLIPDLDKAAKRLLAAASGGEKIAIYGDYDVDGITATAILFHVIKAVAPGADVVTYVPHRDEGYGLSSGAIEQLAGQGVKVIVSVDCGVTAVEPAKTARKVGIDLLITDHHTPPATVAGLPDAFAVVHPRRPDSTYPFGELSGAGVAYKLAWRLATMASGGDRAAPAVRSLLIELLAFAALGTVADVVPLVGENRVLTRFGMERIRASPFVGMKALVEASGLSGEKIGAMDIGFKLGPRLNACGRMHHASAAVELFTTSDPLRAKLLAEELTRDNAQRQTVERRIAATAAAMVQTAGMHLADRRGIVLSDCEIEVEQAWQKGVVGIVCSRLVEQFCRPTLLLCLEREGEHAGLCAGSGRSIEGFNLHSALEECKDLFVSFGGHAMAAGVKLKRENVAEFAARFTAICNERIGDDELIATAKVDAATTCEELTLEQVRRVEGLAPFGAGNAQPTFLLRNCRIDGPPVPMGKAGEHLSLSLRDGGGGGGGGVGGEPVGRRVLRTVAWKWGAGAQRAKLVAGARIHAVVKVSISTYRGEAVEPELVDAVEA